MVAGEAKKIAVRFRESGEDERAVIAGWTQNVPRIDCTDGDITTKLALQRSGAAAPPVTWPCLSRQDASWASAGASGGSRMSCTMNLGWQPIFR